jgi:protein-disulfide isomerase
MSKLEVKVTEADHYRGSLNAPIVLVEYGDFECPFCAIAYPEIEKLVTELGENICFVFRHFPLPNIHHHAVLAAVSAEAAGRQGAFWQMHHLLFQNNENISTQTIVALAQSLGLDMHKFRSDIESKDLLDKIQQDLIVGVRSGVDGTPGIFINGKHYQDKVTYDHMMFVIGKIFADQRGKHTGPNP